MLAVFRHHFVKYRGQILGWGLSLAVLGGFMLMFYEAISVQQEGLLELIQQFPPELFVFFGDPNQIFTPAGYLHTEFFSYMPIILGFFSILAGAALIAGDEESGALDLILAHPVSRAGQFAGRLLAYLAATILILALAWAGFALTEIWIDMGITPLEMALPFLSILSLLLVFGTFAVLLSMVLPSARMAASIAAVLLIASYFITSLSKVQPDLEAAAQFSPMTYYQGGEAVNGMNWGWFLALLGISLVFILAALAAFQRKDIRVGGEGSVRFGRVLRRGKTGG